jgi:hypothetical protein
VKVEAEEHIDNGAEESSESDDDDDEDEDEDDDDDNATRRLTIDRTAQFLAQHRSPKESERWAAQNLRRPSPPVFEPGGDDGCGDDTQSHEDEIPASQYFEEMFRRRPAPVQPDPPPRPKRSIFDAQPDARRISFDSQGPSPAPQSAQRPRPPTESPAAEPAAKRARTERARPRAPPETEDDDDDFQEYNPPPNQERLRQSRESASARRPPPPTARNVREDILDHLHGMPTPPRPGGAHAVRKGRGWEWTPEQEAFFIRKIAKYGPAWADLAQLYCKPGKALEGRDQARLKDKARNIKEKCIR